MANKNEATIIKWLSLLILACNILFGAGILYSQHKQLIPMVERLTNKVQENEIGIAVNATRNAIQDRDIERIERNINNK